MKKLILLLLFIPLVSLGQNNYKLGNYNKLVNKNIEFRFKEPLPPFEKIQESYSIQGNTNLVTAYMQEHQTILLHYKFMLQQYLNNLEI